MEQLPLDLAWPEILKCLKEHSNLVLVAEPGAGKTTRFPPLLLKSGLIDPSKNVLMLEPRRLAARAAASRIADEQGWSVGAEVGYQVRFENKTSAQTKLKILTEGLLTRLLQTDPELQGTGAILLDEFHERSQHTDLALGILSELQQLTRPDLRLIVMSATLDAEKVAKYLGDCPIVRVPGRTYPVTVHHGTRPLSLESGPTLFDRVSESVLNIVEGRAPSEGDLLVFLPGTREIRGVRERIQDRAARAGYETVELHGSLSLEEQDRAIKKDRSRFEKKIVLSTNIAETSLTLDGIGTVIDSGLARVSRFDAAGFSRLQLSRISLASATQRSGRAGRQGPGISHRLWSKIDEASMPDFEQPEILRTDLTEPLMTLLAQGVRDPESFSWFETPPPQALRAALTTLDELGFRDPKTGELSSDGKLALKLPLPVRPARLVLEAARIGQARLGAELAALLTEKDIVLRSYSGQADRSGFESDVLVRLHKLHDTSARDVDRIGKQICLKAADQIERIARGLNFGPSRTWANGLDQDEVALKLVLLGYPDRICRRRRAGEKPARMIGGKGVRLAPFSSVEQSEFFISLDSMEPPPGAPGIKNEVLISLASRIDRKWVEEFFAPHLRPTSTLVFDDTTRSVVEQSALCLRDLPMTEPRIKKPNVDDAHAVLVKECLANWDIWFASRDDLKSLVDRVQFLKDNGLDVSLDDDFKTAFLEEACFGSTKLDEVLAKNLSEIAHRHLTPEITSALRKEAPSQIEVPSGSSIKIQYPEARAPFIEVRIQEIFGWTESPRLASGRVSLQLHLLGPNYRPVQVTSDLASFWRTGYLEVRKELRLRYPKHSWPEDPFTAKPEAKGRPRR